MESPDRRTTQALVHRYGIHPKRHLGQNFLVSQSTVRRILKAAALEKNETILEIGGGLGALTIPLLRHGARLVVYEREPGLCRALEDLLAPFPQSELHCKDARKISAPQLPREAYRLIANLPYGVGTVILRTLLESTRPPKEAFVMLQRDVAERICAKVPRMNLLALAMQSLAEPKILFRIPARASWPEPDVESALLCLRTRTPRPKKNAYDALLRLARIGFAHPRKQLVGNFSRAFGKPAAENALALCGIAEKSRAQELSLTQWQRLTEHLAHV